MGLKKCFLLALAGSGLAWADQTVYRITKLYSLTSIDKIEYYTFAELMEPLRKKMEKGKLDPSEFKIKEGMAPKGGVLAAEITTQKKFLADPDPVVTLKVMKDSVGTALESCDADSQKPGITTEYNNFKRSYQAKEDENHPTMVFECAFKRPLPDTFYLDLVTFDGKSKSRYRMHAGK